MIALGDVAADRREPGEDGLGLDALGDDGHGEAAPQRDRVLDDLAQARVAMALEARRVEIVVMAPEVRSVGTAVTALGPEVPAVSEIVIVVVMEETTARSASGCRSHRTFR